MVFQFEHMGLDSTTWQKWDFCDLPLVKLKDCYRRWQQELGSDGWNSLFMDNHDLPRIVSRWGNDREYRVESAKMLATMLHGMQGTPYIYQGEELGMTNIRLPLEEYVDVEIHNLYRDRTAEGYAHDAIMESIWKRGRDNARTPMQWTAGENAGFTTGKPWLTVNPNHEQINAEAALADPDSVFYYYQELIKIRKSHDVIRTGSFTLLCPEDEKVFAYTRETADAHLLVVCNFSAEARSFEMPERFRNGKVLIANYKDKADTLRPYEAMMLYFED